MVFIEIARLAGFLINNYEGFYGVVQQYNSVLRNTSNEDSMLVFANLYLGELPVSDAHKVTKDGHKRITEQILNCLSNKAEFYV